MSLRKPNAIKAKFLEERHSKSLERISSKAQNDRKRDRFVSDQKMG